MQNDSKIVPHLKKMKWQNVNEVSCTVLVRQVFFSPTVCSDEFVKAVRQVWEITPAIRIKRKNHTITFLVFKRFHLKSERKEKRESNYLPESLCSCKPCPRRAKYCLISPGEQSSAKIHGRSILHFPASDIQITLFFNLDKRNLPMPVTEVNSQKLTDKGGLFLSAQTLLFT